MTEPFISVADLGEYTGQDLSVSDLAVMMTDAACESIRSYMDQHINLVEDETVVMQGRDRTMLILPEHPIVSVDSVTLDDTDLTVLDPTDYRISNFRSMLERVDGNEWSSDVLYTIVYTHGWAVIEADVDVPAGIERVPSSIRAIALSLAAVGMVSGTVGVGGVKSEQLGRYRYTLADENSSGSSGTKMGLDESQMERLDAYRVEGVA